MIRRPRVVLLLPALALAMLAIGPAAAFGSTVITLSGATASYPLLELLTAKYSKLHHHKIRFSLAQGGTSVGISDVASGRVEIGDASRGPASSDPSGLDFYEIAKYFVCVVTNKANPISNLSASQVEQIFEGKVRNWNQVEGSTLTTPIDVDSRTSVAGVLTTFQSTLMGGGKVFSGASQYATEGEEQTAIKKDPNAIGFLSDYFALAPGLDAAAYDGVGCTVANTVNETYPGWSYFYEVTNGPASGPAAKFIHWIQHDKQARKIIETNWVPLSITKTVSG